MPVIACLRPSSFVAALCGAAALIASPAPPAQQRPLQFAEDGVVVAELSASNPGRVCANGARWLRIGFQDLRLEHGDALELRSSGGDRVRLAGAQWNGRRFHTRALRGACVDFTPRFARAGSHYRVASYQAGAGALADTGAVVAAAGDVCDSTPGDCRKTADLVLAMDPAMVLALGDHAYDSGSLAEYTSRYHPAWGAFKELTAPVPGNHEYGTPGAAGYFDYFNGAGAQDGLAGDRSRGYYSYDLGEWHLIALNSRTGGTVASTQLAWLDADLRANTKPCTLAYWHHPLLSSGRYTGYATIKPIFDRLYAARVDLALVAHDHNYQRYAPMDGDQAARVDGVRQVIVGTGGADLASVARTHPLLEARQGSTWGVLRLDLAADGYEATFVPVAGRTYTDRFSGGCHRAQGVVGDFLLGASASLSVPRGRSGAKLVSVASYGGFDRPVTLAAAGLPAGVSASFAANPVVTLPDASASSRLTLRVAAGAPVGTFTITVTGAAGTLQRKATFKLIVK